MADATTSLAVETERPSRFWVTACRALLTLAVPVLLVLGSARLVMTRAFLYFDYTRPGFPSDIYGFSTQDRLQYAPYALDYLLNGEDISFLADLRLPSDRCITAARGASDCAMYTAGELRHMRDVKVVARIAFLVAVGMAVSAGIILYMMMRDGQARVELWGGLFFGGILTLSIIAAVVFAATLNWDYFFTAFHTLFFAGGTWRFAYSDTLIRLFPEQFWFDAALAIGATTAAAAAAILTVAWTRLRLSRKT